MKSVNQLVLDLKENDEDFEWYPTTQEIADRLGKELKKDEYNYHSRLNSIMDIGCGNGSFFEKLEKTIEFYVKYGIEKSNVLYQQLPSDVVLLGSDFYEQNLIDKKVDVIFCNPPYSDFETWAEKIILQGNAKIISLVIPSRWKESGKIKEALQKRKLQVNVLGTYDFFNAERKARAVVDLLYINRTEDFGGRTFYDEPVDAFDVWFNDTFKIKAEIKHEYLSDIREEVKNELVERGDTAKMLVELYNRDMTKLYNNYRALEELDPELFEELKVNVDMLKKSLKVRLEGLKTIYWNLLFERYDKIKTRLTKTGKDKLLKRLEDNTSIDFTLQNIFMITLWIINNSNTLFDEQITEFFYTLCNSDSIIQYKSNKRWNDDDWRYVKETFDKEYWRWDKEHNDKHYKYMKNVMLDYRIVIKSYGGNFTNWCHANRLTTHCVDFLNDIIAVAYNLGYVIENKIPADEEINVEDWKNFDLITTDGKVFANVKLYWNGNKHIKFCKEFMKKLNIEMARINGWVQSKDEVVEEMGMNEADVSRFWNSNLKLGIDSADKLLGLPANIQEK